MSLSGAYLNLSMMSPLDIGENTWGVQDVLIVKGFINTQPGIIHMCFVSDASLSFPSAVFRG